MSAAARVLGGLQRALEALYRVKGPVDVGGFLLDEAQRESLGPGRLPDEQLLLVEESGDLAVGLFVDAALIGRLEVAGGARLADFVVAVEGVSHFLYATLRAHEGRCFSALELELQAEVDKYLMALLSSWQPAHGPAPRRLRSVLFRETAFHPDLSTDERERYRRAHEAAEAYTAHLEERYLPRRDVAGMLDEARRFFRLDCAGKLDRISALGATRLGSRFARAA